MSCLGDRVLSRFLRISTPVSTHQSEDCSRAELGLDDWLLVPAAADANEGVCAISCQMSRDVASERVKGGRRCNVAMVGDAVVDGRAIVYGGGTGGVSLEMQCSVKAIPDVMSRAC